MIVSDRVLGNTNPIRKAKSVEMLRITLLERNKGTGALDITANCWQSGF